MPEFKIPLIQGDKTEDITLEYRDAPMLNSIAIDKPILGDQGYIRSWPGLIAFNQSLTGRDRAAMWDAHIEQHFRLSGTEFGSVSSTGVWTVLGSVLGIDQGTMATSFNSLCVVANGELWRYDYTGLTFTKNIDANIGVPIDLTWINAKYVMTDGEYIYHTTEADETVVEPLAYSGSDLDPDPILAVDVTQDNKLVVFNRYSTEYFQDVANPNFAFTRIESRAVKVGIVATHAKVRALGTYFIVGSRRNEDLAVYQIGGGTANMISNRQMNIILNTYTDGQLSDVRLDKIVWNGSTYILVHLPDHVLCFNVSASSKLGPTYAWSVLYSEYSTFTPYRGINAIYDPRIAKWVVGDILNSGLGEFDPSTAMHYNQFAYPIMYSPLLSLETLSIDRIELKTIAGSPDPIYSGDAQVLVALTYDGRTYQEEIPAFFNITGDDEVRFILRRLGYVRELVGFRFRVVSRRPLSFAGFIVEAS